MISIIICLRKAFISKELYENISLSIGYEYELICIDNSENKYSIFEAYNLGIAKSKGKYLCFVHDDIFIHTKKWGEIIDKIFKEDCKIGLIGVAGSKVKTKMPSAWWDCDMNDRQLNIIQHFPHKDSEYWGKGEIESVITNVAIIDGVFMAARKVNGVVFHEKMKGFHNYDLNFSLEYLKNGYKVVTTNNILLEHYSLGTLNKSWYVSALYFHKLYNEMLPINLFNNDMKTLEFKNGSRFIIELLNLKMKKESFCLWLKLFCLKPLSKFHFKFLNQFLK